MAKFRWNRFKSNRSYTYREAGRLLGAHVRTVQSWRELHGLPVMDGQTPHLILGRDLIALGKRLRTSRKAKTRSDQMYCLGCKAPRVPAFGEVEYVASEAPTVNLMGLCPECTCVMCKRVPKRSLDRLAGIFCIRRKQ